MLPYVQRWVSWVQFSGSLTSGAGCCLWPFTSSCPIASLILCWWLQLKQNLKECLALWCYLPPGRVFVGFYFLQTHGGAGCLWSCAAKVKVCASVLVVLDPRELGLVQITLIPCMLPLARQAVGLQRHRVSGVCGASVAWGLSQGFPDRHQWSATPSLAVPHWALSLWCFWDENVVHSPYLVVLQESSNLKCSVLQPGSPPSLWYSCVDIRSPSQVLDPCSGKCLWAAAPHVRVLGSGHV